MTTRPVDKVFQDIPKLRETCYKYLDDCEQSLKAPENIITLKNGERRSYGTRPSIIGLCLILDINKSTFYRYLNEDKPNVSMNKDDIEEIREIFARVNSVIEQTLYDQSLSGMIDSKIASIMLPQYGYTAKQEIDASVTVRFAGMSEEEAKKYMR